MTDIAAELRGNCRCGGVCLRCRGADEIERLRKLIGWLSRLLKRYRQETPLGNQPHMIALEVDNALRELEESDE